MAIHDCVDFMHGDGNCWGYRHGADWEYNRGHQACYRISSRTTECDAYNAQKKGITFKGQNWATDLTVIKNTGKVNVHSNHILSHIFTTNSYSSAHPFNKSEIIQMSPREPGKSRMVIIEEMKNNNGGWGYTHFING